MIEDRIVRIKARVESSDRGTKLNTIEVQPITRSQCVTLDQSRYSSQTQDGNQCRDRVDNDADGNFDSGLCVFDGIATQPDCTAANAAAGSRRRMKSFSPGSVMSSTS